MQFKQFKISKGQEGAIRIVKGALREADTTALLGLIGLALIELGYRGKVILKEKLCEEK